MKFSFTISYNVGPLRGRVIERSDMSCLCPRFKFLPRSVILLNNLNDYGNRSTRIKLTLNVITARRRAGSSHWTLKRVFRG